VAAPLCIVFARLQQLQGKVKDETKLGAKAVLIVVTLLLLPTKSPVGSIDALQAPFAPLMRSVGD
jgi:hypothetical protein